MKHLILIRIKNEEFDYGRFGITNSYFTIDISQAINHSKNVGFTQYALLDGTTRMDNISREPGSISIQGVLGEIRGGNKSENFVMSTLSRTRLQNQMDLLEALRDEAIFLDIITDERTYRDYMIAGINYGKTRSSEATVSLTLKEILTFGDRIDVIETERTYDMSPYERSLILDEFYMRPIETDAEMVAELNRVINHSVLTSPFIIRIGSANINADSTMSSYPYKKHEVNVSLKRVGESSIRKDTNSAYSTRKAEEIITGSVVDNYYLHLSVPQVTKGTNIFSTRFTLNPSLKYDVLTLADTFVNIKLMKDKQTVYSTSKGTILMEPRYADISNGIHFLNNSHSNNDVISTAQYATSFVRKQKNGNYTIVPNLLGHDSRGFLYKATYQTATGSIFTLNPMLIYIHPSAWNKIKDELNRVWKESKYFRDKGLM